MITTKIIAMYLPQFHRIPENDAWWGDGFTEWTNVRKAKPLFEGHYQPRIPLNSDYYDLSDGSRIIEQMECARDNHIDAFCIYHYWFNGIKLLEKPVELMNDNDELPVDYCLCWANEPWTRTWDGAIGAKEVLMGQEYGDLAEWKEHFDYLYRFFVHKNYLKVRNRPVFVIYKGVQIKKRKEMIDYWNSLACDKGFDGLYIVYAHREQIFNEIPFERDSYFDFEPFATLRRMHDVQRKAISKKYDGLKPDGIGKHYYVIDYEKFCKIMLDRFPGYPNHYLGFFVGWDNTPRCGNNSELFFEHNEPDIAKRVFEKQYSKSINLDKEFLFINAWNEWGEGTYLEPDERYGYGYLHAIKEVVEEYG